MSGDARFGVEPFDVEYGSGLQVEADSSLVLECPIIEGNGTLTARTPAPGERPAGLAFVDGSLRVEARLTRTTAIDGTTTGVAGCASAGAVVVPADGGPLRFQHVEVRRYAIFAGGHRVELPDQPGGWRWEADSVPDVDLDHARNRLQRHMRDAEVAIAEKLWADGVLTVVDGPLTMVRSGWDTPIIGYVKTHHRRMLAAEDWAKVPRIGVGQRTSAFQIRNDLYGAYLRVGDPGPWASPWGGIVRLEVPVGVGLDRALNEIDAASAWIPEFASAVHRDPRAPVNLTPVGGLEHHLRHLHGDARLGLRAVRTAILQLNQEGTP